MFFQLNFCALFLNFKSKYIFLNFVMNSDFLPGLYAFFYKHLHFIFNFEKKNSALSYGNETWHNGQIIYSEIVLRPVQYVFFVSFTNLAIIT